MSEKHKADNLVRSMKQIITASTDRACCQSYLYIRGYLQQIEQTYIQLLHIMKGKFDIYDNKERPLEEIRQKTEKE